MIKSFSYKITEFMASDDTLAQKLNKEVKVLCWVMTSPDNHQLKVIFSIVIFNYFNL